MRRPLLLSLVFGAAAAATGVACASDENDHQLYPASGGSSSSMSTDAGTGATGAVPPLGDGAVPCHPDFCPTDPAGNGRACCLPSGNCGFDWGVGCTSNPPPTTSTGGAGGSGA